MCRISSIRSSSIDSRPAVSTISTSRPRRLASSRPAVATATGSDASENIDTPAWPASTRSCSTAAGRWRSAPTRSGLRPCCLNQRASLADAVVLPEPWSPASRMTVGGRLAYRIWRVSPPRMATSSSLTILMTCWPGLKLWESSSPTHRSRSAVVNLRTTPISTSASRRAVRISRSTSSTSASVRRPRPRSRVRMPSNRSVRLSNMGCSGYPTTVAGPCARSLASGGSEQGVDEGLGVEVDEVARTFAESDQLDREAEFALDGHHDPALGRAVQFGQHHPGDVDGIEEDLGLGQAVLTGGGVEHQEHLGHVTRGSVRYPSDLLQLLDQVDLVVEPAGRVGQHQRLPLGSRPLDGVEDHRARVAPLGPAHDVGAGPLGPQTELLAGRGPEGVAGGQEHRGAVPGQPCGHLAHRGGLADPVDSDEQPHVD